MLYTLLDLSQYTTLWPQSVSAVHWILRCILGLKHYELLQFSCHNWEVMVLVVSAAAELDLVKDFIYWSSRSPHNL